MRGTIDDDELHIGSQFLQLLKICEVPIETANHAKGRHFHR